MSSSAARIGMRPQAVRACVDELDDLLERLATITAELGATRVILSDWSGAGAALGAACDAKQTQIVQALITLAGLITAKKETLQAALEAVEDHDRQSCEGHRRTQHYLQDRYA